MTSVQNSFGWTGGSGGGSGTLTAANNGLTLSSTTVQMGGPLIQNTTIELGSYNLILTLTTGKFGIGISPNTTIHVNGTSSFLTTTSSASTLTLSGSTAYVFTGTTTTWTAPAISGNSSQFFYVKNRGTGAITLNSNSGSQIYTASALVSLIINPGESYLFFNDGTYWNSN